MSASISIQSVTLDYPVYSVRAQSLRAAVLDLAVGGRLMRSQSDLTVVRALNNVSFRLKDGDRLGMMGHNGSGKSTMLKVLAGVYEPSMGVVDIRGRVSSMVSMSVGLDPEATGLQNIRNLAMMQGASTAEVKKMLPSIIDFSGLGTFIHMPFKTYSAGMMARLTFSVGTSLGAEILLLDEWLNAGDVEFQAKASARVTELVGSANIVVLASHDIHIVRRVCNKLLVLEAGSTIYFGDTETFFLENPEFSAR